MSSTKKMTINETIERFEKVCPYLKPTAYVPFGPLIVFQTASKDGTPIYFDNLMAVHRSNKLVFPFNPLKFGEDYARVATKFIAIEE